MKNFETEVWKYLSEKKGGGMRFLQPLWGENAQLFCIYQNQRRQTWKKWFRSIYMLNFYS